MVVKNEQNRIARAIRSVLGSVGEMIVVDTGSTDGTREMACELGAAVVEHPFNGDFSEARNVGLKECRGEWVLVLDADEFFPLSPKLLLETSVDPVVAGLTNPYKGYYVLRHNYEENDQAVSYSDYVLRLFRYIPGVTYRHRVHETVEESLDALDGKYGKLTSLPISHYLFERGESYLDAKRQVYLAGLLKDIEDDPSDAGRYDYLGCEYARLGRLEDAERAFRTLLKLDPQNPGGIESLAMVLQLLARDREAAGILDRR